MSNLPPQTFLNILQTVELMPESTIHPHPNADHNDEEFFFQGIY